MSLMRRCSRICLKVFKAFAQVSQKVVVGVNVDPVPMDGHVPASPLQAASIRCGNAIISADYQQQRQLDRSRAEQFLERQAVLLIGEQPHPIDDLAQALLKAWRPCSRMPPTISEDAIGEPVLALNQAIRLSGLIASYNVNDELAEQAHLDGKPVDGVGRVGVGPQERGQMGVLTEAGQDVGLLRELRLRACYELPLSLKQPFCPK